MAHFGIICPPVTGHVDPLAAVGRALIGRGHRATFFHVADLAPKIQSEGLEFVPLGAARFAPGTLAETVRTLAALRGMASLRFAVACAVRLADVVLEDGPEAIRRANVDALLVDQNEPAGTVVADHLGIPYVSTCTSLPLNRDAAMPPPFAPWPPATTFLGRFRNLAGYVITDRVIAPLQATLNRSRRAWGLAPLRRPDDSFSPLAQIAQMPRAFDFPRHDLPATFHYLGPWFDAHGGRIAFPFERLDGRPLVYGSLGTLQPHQSPYFRTMAEACAALDVQLVMSLGKLDHVAVERLPGDPIVVNYAPQLELLSRAAVITHSGMNTTQQALFHGVPLVAVPLTHDQPAIAARTAHCGAGIVIPPKQLTVGRLREALRAVLEPGGSHKRCAEHIRAASVAAGGVQKAADVAEGVVRRPTPSR